MSQFTRQVNESHKVVWGRDEYTDAGLYLCVFGRDNELLVVMDQQHDGLTESALIEYTTFYGVNPVDVAQTLLEKE